MPTTSLQNATNVKLCSLGWTDDSYKQFYETAQVVTGLVIYPLVCTLGVVGNTLTIFVLSRRNMLTSTNAFLSALAVSDSIKLVNDSMYILVTVLLRTDPELGKTAYGYLYPYAHFIFSMSVSVSAWLTVSVAVERYILVCHPTRARTFWNRRRAVMLCMSIYLVMTVLALPSALRYRTIRCVDRKTNMSRLEVELTEIWRNQSLVTAYEWVQNLLRSTIPSLLLIVLNVCIIAALRRTKAKRHKNPRHRVTIMMIVVILVFLICITPDAILSTVFGFGYHEASYLGKGIREITDCLLTLNAGVNFIIYCAFNQAFRTSFTRICCIPSQQTGWVTELDESAYRRLSEAKYLLSTNNNSTPRHCTTTKLTPEAVHRDSRVICCPGGGVTVMAVGAHSKKRKYQMTNVTPAENKQDLSPLISASLSPAERNNSHTHQQQSHHSHHRMSSSGGLRKSKNSVKCNRAKNKNQVTFNENIQIGKKLYIRNGSGHNINTSDDEDAVQNNQFSTENISQIPKTDLTNNYQHLSKSGSQDCISNKCSADVAHHQHKNTTGFVIHDTVQLCNLPVDDEAQIANKLPAADHTYNAIINVEEKTNIQDQVRISTLDDSLGSCRKMKSVCLFVTDNATSEPNICKNDKGEILTNTQTGNKDTFLPAVIDVQEEHNVVENRPKPVILDQVSASSFTECDILTTDL